MTPPETSVRRRLLDVAARLGNWNDFHNGGIGNGSYGETMQRPRIWKVIDRVVSRTIRRLDRSER